MTELWLTRNLPGVAQVKTLICKKDNAANFLPSLIYDFEHFWQKEDKPIHFLG